MNGSEIGANELIDKHRFTDSILYSSGNLISEFMLDVVKILHNFVIQIVVFDKHINIYINIRKYFICI